MPELADKRGLSLRSNPVDEGTMQQHRAFFIPKIKERMNDMEFLKDLFP